MAAAKAACAAGGLIQIGPGLEALTLGTDWTNIVLALVTDDGVGGMSRFHMLDGTDPMKRLFWDVSAITTATTRTVTAPNYSGYLLLPASLGNSGEFLRSGGAGVQPTWAAVTVTNALLDASNHTDTAAGSVTRGDIIYGNSTPKWARLAKGAANTVLTSDGTDVAWSLNPAVQHDALAHLKPISIASCSWSSGSTTISSANLPGAVKVGDYVLLGSNASPTAQGRKVATLGAGSITVDAAQTSGSTISGTFYFQPGDHFDDTLAPDSTGAGVGLFMTGGRGTYNASTGSTFQELRGPINWRGHGTSEGSQNTTDFRVAGSDSASGGENGFCIKKNSTGGERVYFYTGDLTGVRTLTIPNSSGALMTQTSTDSSITGSKTFSGPVILVSDGTTNHTVFQTAGGSNFLGFSATGTTLRNVTWPDVAGNAVVRNAADNKTGQTALVATTTLATAPAAGMYRVSGFMNCTSAGAGNAVLQIDWTDDTARTAQTVCTLDKGATNYAQGSLVIYVGSGNVSYNVTYAGTGTYTVRVRMEAI